MVLDKKTKSLVLVGAIVLVALILLLVLGTAGNRTHGNGNATKTVSGTKENIKVGVTLPLTGDVAFLGIADKNALMMAYDELPKDTKYNYELVIEDNAYDAKKVASNMQKFINVEDVDIVISFSSLVSNVVAPIAEDNKLVFIAASSSDLNVADGKYGFDFVTTPQKEAEKLVQELKKRDYKKVGIAIVNLEFTQAVKTSLESNFDSSGIEVVAEETFNPGATDFKTGILKLKESDAEIIVFLMHTPEVELFKKQYDSLGVDIPITAVESFGVTEEKDLFEGEWYVDSGYPDEEFFTKYSSIYGEEPSAYAADIYSVFNIIVDAYESSNTKLSSDQVASKLLTVRNFDTPLGSVSSNSNGVFEIPATVKQIKNGESVLIG